VNLPVQHLSAQAIAAFADGMLAGTPRARAQRHIACCVECRTAVDIQREAMAALRGSRIPAPPSTLLERLRSLPSTAPLPARRVALDRDGTAVFPAYGTPNRSAVPPAPLPAPTEHETRRHPQGGLLMSAAAVLTLGALAAGTASGLRENQTPGGGATSVRTGAPGPAVHTVGTVSLLDVSTAR
jgi:hypothetical protein